MDYLSPTSISLFERDVELFYLRYLRKTRILKDIQTKAMAAGAAFDAFVKGYLYRYFYGNGNDYFLNLFEKQVDPENRDFGIQIGKMLFDKYFEAGCVADLIFELKGAVKPHFEFELKNQVSGVPLMGRPDLFFINEEGGKVVYDWKVNGVVQDSLKSPMKGYVKLRDSEKGVSIHKDTVLLKYKGILVNIGMFLEEGNRDWAQQLSIYSWLLGEEIGSEEIIVGIDQICGPVNRLRFATHRLKIGKGFQESLMARIKEIWEIIQSGWIFRDLSVEDSKRRCELLEMDSEEMELKGWIQ